MSSIKIRQTTLKDGRQSLYLDIYYNGRNIHKSLKLFLNKPDSIEAKKQNETILLIAEKVKIKFQEEMLNGTFGKEKETIDITLLDWFKQLTYKKKKTGINFQAWHSTLKHLIIYFQSNPPILLKDISQSVLANIKEHYLKSVSQNSASSYFDIIKHGIHEAFRSKLIVYDPAIDCKSIKYKNPPREFLTEDELKKLIETDCELPVLKKAFLFSCITGLRHSDCRNLIWNNLQHTTEMGYFIRFTQQKTQESETIHLSDSAIKIIGIPSADLNEKVFKGLTYSAWINLKLSQWFMKAGITKKSHFHMARHTCATLLLQKGVDIFTVSKILGHKDLKTTMVYAKIVDKNKREAINKLDQIFI